jgi:hypothetical protein
MHISDHVVILNNLLNAVFWTFIALDVSGIFKTLDPFYKEYGFCRSQKENQGFDSFELCF